AGERAGHGNGGELVSGRTLQALRSGRPRALPQPCRRGRRRDRGLRHRAARGRGGMSSPLRPPLFDRRRLQHSFGRAAAGYAEVAVLQREAESRLLEQLEVLEARVPARVLDVGSGPGRASGVMKGRWPKSEVIALDIALPML